jgi:hypothetical protein
MKMVFMCVQDMGEGIVLRRNQYFTASNYYKHLPTHGRSREGRCLARTITHHLLSIFMCVVKMGGGRGFVLDLLYPCYLLLIGIMEDRRTTCVSRGGALRVGREISEKMVFFGDFLEQWLTWSFCL